MDALLDEGPVAISVYDSDLNFVLQNAQLRRISGLSDADRRRGLTVSDTMPGPEGGAIRRRQRDVLESGRPRTDQVHEDDHVWAESLFPLVSTAGEPFAVGHVILDVTERVRARERLALINDMSSRIGNELDLVQTADELADAAVPEFADSAQVDLLGSVLDGSELAPGPVAADAVLRRVACQSVGPEAGANHSGNGPCAIPPRILAQGSPVLLREPEPGGGSQMIMPLSARGITLGTVVFARWSRPEPFGEDDLLLAEQVAARAGACLDNARRYLCERAAALALQRSLLPRSESRQAVEVATRYMPASGPHGLGGDWFDVIPLSGARVALVMGDAVGDGLQAAVTMGRLRTAVRTLADLDLEPDELLNRLNDQACRFVSDHGVTGVPSRTDAPDRGVDGGGVAFDTSAAGSTCLYAVYDPISLRCVLASAGHPPPLLAAPGGKPEAVDLPVGPPLGASSLPFEAREIALPEGGTLALYTDGLLDHRDGGAANPERLRSVLARPDLTPEAICDAVVETMTTTAPDDDATLLVARLRTLGPDRLAVWDLHGESREVAGVRALVRRQLVEWGLEHLTFTTELVASELVTNAIRYGSAPVQLRLIRDQSLICEVSDGNSTSPHLRRARTTDEGGRGLLLVAQFTRSWGTRYARRGKTIWAAQSVQENEGDIAQDLSSLMESMPE
ncbi:SpoIIE family protein phosphatase [Streptomyces rapamycinicus]|uniref:PPM-type phosphatase domain-containing protein n=2 Tax=Streptomyces rapamycinicus TaxID=1226757 RepID=A0A3L8RE32_STRRN|nr:SpoIIE family protein phosphatase [Streptomyces rapamycinicus]MBB4786855.1 PAS domain S-box-containing protein [Streptomyces rapamycinicus]RLV77688.1 hypothetical protein D3C57_104925 [Streptomyces rapamycinicus NRRL 5491]